MTVTRIGHYAFGTWTWRVTTWDGRTIDSGQTFTKRGAEREARRVRRYLASIVTTDHP